MEGPIEIKSSELEKTGKGVTALLEKERVVLEN